MCAITVNTAALRETTWQIPQLFQRLSRERQEEFFTFIERAVEGKKHLTSREERKLRRALREELEIYKIENADDVADTLVDMGIYEDITSLVPLLRTEEIQAENSRKLPESWNLRVSSLILHTAYNLAAQQAA